jgi:hypothetical protein
MRLFLDVAEEQLVASPDRPLGEREATRDLLGHGVLRDQVVKRGGLHLEQFCHFGPPHYRVSGG